MDDWLGATQPLSYHELVNTSDRVVRKLEFLDKAGREVGHVNIATQYIWAEPSSSPRASYVGGHGHHGETVTIREGYSHGHHSPERITIRDSHHGDSHHGGHVDYIGSTRNYLHG